MRRQVLIGLYSGLFAFLIASLGRAADLDSDGIEDSIDVCCDTPPGVDVDEFGRPLGDIDFDCDLDLADFGIFQRNLTGAMFSGCCGDADCEDGDPCTVNLCSIETGSCAAEVLPNCSDCVIGAECGTELLCDDQAAGTIDPIFETDAYCFCAVEGEGVRVTVAELAGSGSNFAPNWRLLDGGGNPFGACSAFATTAGRDCGPLPAAGNPYRIEVEDQGRNDIGNYGVHLHLLEPGRDCGAAAVQCDIPLTSTIDHANDADLFSFNVLQGEVVRVSVVEGLPSGANFAPFWRLLDGVGTPAGICGTGATGASRDCGPLSAAANPYRIEVEDQGRNDTGMYTVHIQRLMPQHACDSMNVECDTPLVRTIDSSIDSDLFSFHAGNNEIVRVSVVETTPSGPNFAPFWRMLDGSGTPFGTCATGAATVSRDCGPLPTAGSPYSLEVEDQGRNDSGGFKLHIQRLSAVRDCDTARLACDVVVNGTISDPIDTDLAEFAAPEGETVRISILEQSPSGPDFAPNWRLLNASGVATSNCSAFAITPSRDCGPLPASGNPYRVEVEDQTRNDTGTYQILLDMLTSGCP